MKPYLLFLVIVVLAGCRLADEGSRVCFEDSCVRVEVVSTPEEMQKGLQGRSHLSADAGMLFVFPEAGRHMFWMKDTLIPLDMIWMNQHREIIHIEKDVPPCRLDPCPTYGPDSYEPAYVLEVNAGTVLKQGWLKGLRADFYLRQ